MKKIEILISISLLFLLSSCGAFFNQPIKKQNARLGEEVFVGSHIRGVKPIKPIVVGVYKFRDQTGQYKQVESGVSYSTAVTQGATTILIKALEDSEWFTPIERENVSNLLNERQIIRSTRLEESKKNGTENEVAPLSPLLFSENICTFTTNIPFCPSSAGICVILVMNVTYHGYPGERRRTSYHIFSLMNR